MAFWTAEAFCKAMTDAGNRCELEGCPGQAHGFFNFGRAGNRNFSMTVKRADRFLVSLGYLQGGDTVTSFLENLK